MSIRSSLAFAGLAVSLALTGCASNCPKIDYCDTGIVCPPGGKDANLIGTNYNAIDALLKSSHCVHACDRVLVATLVDLNDLHNTSVFGRVAAEQLGGRLTQRGCSVVYVKLRNDSLVIRNEGEFLLSRDLRDLGATHNAKAALVGTYARGRDNVFVSVRLVRTLDNVVLGSVDYEIPTGPETLALLEDSASATYVSMYSSPPVYRR